MLFLSLRITLMWHYICSHPLINTLTRTCCLMSYPPHKHRGHQAPLMASKSSEGSLQWLPWTFYSPSNLFLLNRKKIDLPKPKTDSEGKKCWSRVSFLSWLAKSKLLATIKVLKSKKELRVIQGNRKLGNFVGVFVNLFWFWFYNCWKITFFPFLNGGHILLSCCTFHMNPLDLKIRKQEPETLVRSESHASSRGQTSNLCSTAFGEVTLLALMSLLGIRQEGISQIRVRNPNYTIHFKMRSIYETLADAKL